MRNRSRGVPADFDVVAAVEATVDRRMELMEQARLPEEWRREAMLSVPIRSEAIRGVDTREDMERVNALMDRGYAWARESQFTFIQTPDAIDDLVETMGVNASTWVTITGMCWGIPAFYGRNDVVDEREFHEVTLEQIGEYVSEVGSDPSFNDNAAQAMSDAFSLGATMCGAEKCIVLAVEWSERRSRAKSMQRWDWLPWRRTR